MKIRHLLILILLALTSSIMPQAIGQQYYGFYRSDKPELKILRHNILGFEIEIPLNWTLGISGSDNLLVAFLYPDSLNTGKISSDYEVIEIGNLGSQTTGLEVIYEITWRGIQSRHKSIVENSAPEHELMGDYKAISFDYTWRSKDGYLIFEKIYLIQTEKDVRSVAVRLGDQMKGKEDTYHKIIETFRPLNSNG